MIENNNLLVIDDDYTYREVLARTLKRHGFDTCTAASPEQALQLCQTQQPQYILLDLNLDGDSGLKLIDPLLAIVPNARIVMLTGYASIPTAVSALKLGAYQYLAKPANTDDILHALLEDNVDIPEVDDNQRMTVEHLEWEYIQKVLDDFDGNISATAKALKMHRRTLQRKLMKKRKADS